MSSLLYSALGELSHYRSLLVQPDDPALVKARFSAPVQTYTGVHPAFCAVGTVSLCTVGTVSLCTVGTVSLCTVGTVSLCTVGTVSLSHGGKAALAWC
jgi:hypothetical protein